MLVRGRRELKKWVILSGSCSVLAAQDGTRYLSENPHDDEKMQTSGRPPKRWLIPVTI